MNKKWMPHGITTGALVVFIVLGLACASSPGYVARWKDVVYTGESTPMLTGTTWREPKGDGSFVTHEFRPNGVVVSSYPYDFSGQTWQRVGNEISMVLGGGQWLYVGKYDQENKIISGTTRYDKISWEFKWELVE